MTLAPDKTDTGYRIVGGVLGDQEATDLLRCLESSSLTRSRAGARHLMEQLDIQSVAHDPRLMAIAGEFLKESTVPYRATLFDKSLDRNWLVTWHQDRALPLEQRRDVPGWGPWSVKSGITYALAPARAPATHRLGVLSDADIDQVVQSTSPVDCLVAAGGIVAMRPLILHASSKAATACPRRVLHIEYADSLDLGDGLRIAIA